MATFTVKEVEDAARLILLDTYEDAYRFEPKEIFQAMLDGMKHINNVRPESRYVNCLLVDLNFPTIPEMFTTEPNGGTLKTFRDTSINMDNRWREAATYYVVHRMYLKDDADTQNANLAKQYLDMFNASVVS